MEAQQPLNLYGFSEGGFLTAVVQAHELTATHFAFAFWHYGCDVHIWGLEKYGGEWTELLRKQLKQARIGTRMYDLEDKHGNLRSSLSRLVFGKWLKPGVLKVHSLRGVSKGACVCYFFKAYNGIFIFSPHREAGCNSVSLSRFCVSD